jgi:hypothetical protein
MSLICLCVLLGKNCGSPCIIKFWAQLLRPDSSIGAVKNTDSGPHSQRMFAVVIPIPEFCTMAFLLCFKAIPRQKGWGDVALLP